MKDESTNVGGPAASDRRDATWIRLRDFDLQRIQAEDPESPGIQLDTPEVREVVAAIDRLPPGEAYKMGLHITQAHLVSRTVRSGLNLNDDPWELFDAGSYEAAAAFFTVEANRMDKEGRIAAALQAYSRLSRCYNALGRFEEAKAPFRMGRALAARLENRWGEALNNLTAATFERVMALDHGWEGLVAGMELFLRLPTAEVNNYVLAPVRASAALLYARLGQNDESSRWLETLLPALDRAPGATSYYVPLACSAAQAAWYSKQREHLELIERNLREKVVEPDLRYPMMESRREMAHLSALKGEYEEASAWFAKSRAVTEEERLLPLRAIVDHEEAAMLMGLGREDESLALAKTALEQFTKLGMIGWIERAKRLIETGTECEQSDRGGDTA
jgi:tetratricopeptide (TPR) repeat protein